MNGMKVWVLDLSYSTDSAGASCSSSPHLPTSSPAHHYAPSPFIHHLPTDGVKLLLHHPHPLEHPLHYLSISLLVASMINLLHTCCLFTPYVFSTYCTSQFAIVVCASACFESCLSLCVALFGFSPVPAYLFDLFPDIVVPLPD